MGQIPLSLASAIGADDGNRTRMTSLEGSGLQGADLRLGRSGGVHGTRPGGLAKVDCVTGVRLPRSCCLGPVHRA
jgi:hypothetical protein